MHDRGQGTDCFALGGSQPFLFRRLRAALRSCRLQSAPAPANCGSRWLGSQRTPVCENEGNLPLLVPCRSAARCPLCVLATSLQSPVAPEATSSTARSLTFFHRCWGEGQAAPSKIVPPATARVQETIVGVGRGVRIVGKLRPWPRAPGSAAATVAGHRLFLEKSGRNRYSQAKLL